MRIGTNHGSLSDRILSRYGDTPEGMVESALEFLRIAESLNYYDIMPVYERMPMKPLNSKQIFDIEHNLEKIPFKKYLNN